MGKADRKKEVLELFQYEKIKSDVSYSSFMKKTGSNGKGFLDRYFVLHRNYVLYYKPGKGNSKPDDKQEPQGYINLAECDVDETSNKEPLQFLIHHSSNRTYIIKAKDDSSKNQFITLLRTRITALKKIKLIDISTPGSAKSRINEFKEKLPNPLILPDRVSPEKSKEWVNEMRNYNKIFQEADPYIKEAEQFSEICRDEIKEYVDWFSGPEGPRLAMIRCEETVLTNWVDYIIKTKNEIETYEDTRYFREDYDDIKLHLKNMLCLIEAYHDYMRTCRKNTKPVQDRFLEEKSYFIESISKYNNKLSRFDFKLDMGDLQENESVSIKAFGIYRNINNSVIALSSSSSSICSTTFSVYSSSNNNGNDDSNGNYPTYNFSMALDPDGIDSGFNQNSLEKPDDASNTHNNKEQLSPVVLEKWEYSNYSIYIPDNGREELGHNNNNGSSSSFDPRWDYANGYFKSKNMGVVLWNGKSWVWSHPKTSYKIRFDWNQNTQTFNFIPPKPRTGINLSVSNSSNSSTSSLATTKKSNHPTTIYPNWQLKDNNLTSIINDKKDQPIFSNLESSNKLPSSILLLVAMTPHIQSSLNHIGFGHKYITNN